jgi:hypothetical protein
VAQLAVLLRTVAHVIDRWRGHVAGLRCRNCDGKGTLELKPGGPPSDMADVAIQRVIDRIVDERRIIWKDKRGV